MIELSEVVRTSCHPHFHEKLAQELIEPLGKVKKASEISVSSILGGLASRASDPNFMGSVYPMLKNPAIAYLHEQPDKLIDKGKMRNRDPRDPSALFLASVFGASIPALVEGMVVHCGLKHSSVQAVLHSTNPLVMSVLSQTIQQKSLTEQEFTGLLLGEQHSLASAIPPSIASTLGLAEIKTIPAGEFGNDYHKTQYHWIWYLLIVAGMIAAILYWRSKRG